MAKRNHRAKRSSKRRWKASRIISWAALAGLGAAIVGLGLLAFIGDDGETTRRVRQEPVVADEQQVTVDVEDNYFEPDDLTVRAGTEVTWKFKGNAAHDVTDDRGAFESGTMTQGDEFVMTFDDPGTYYYYCTLHHVMQGTLIVKP
jgi:plastocyanin